MLNRFVFRRLQYHFQSCARGLGGTISRRAIVVWYLRDGFHTFGTESHVPLSRKSILIESISQRWRFILSVRHLIHYTLLVSELTHFIHSVIFSCNFVCEASIILLFVYKIIQRLQALTIMIGTAPVRRHEPQNSSAWRRIVCTDGFFKPGVRNILGQYVSCIRNTWSLLKL